MFYVNDLRLRPCLRLRLRVRLDLVSYSLLYYLYLRFPLGRRLLLATAHSGALLSQVQADNTDRPFVTERDGVDVEEGSVERGTEYVDGGST